MPKPECHIEDVEMMGYYNSPIYSPHTPDYSPNSPDNSSSSPSDDFSTTYVNQRRIYGEKINSLDRLTCDPIGERNVLIEQLTFRPLNDVNSNNDEDEDAGIGSAALCGISGGDNESLNGGANAPSVAASIVSGEEYNAAASIAACGDTTEISSNYENKTTGLIIIPSSTVRAYSSFAINRRSIPKLCLVCFRSYCVCAKESIDLVTQDYYDSRNYEFFRNIDDDDRIR